jgi:ubiquinone/menaquinone biosynthesis C-methylase UbiE
MRKGLQIEKLHSVYDKAAEHYDIQHGMLTARSDQRGRMLLVERAVAQGDRVLDSGSGTGSTGLLAARKVGPSGKVVLFDVSEGMLAVACEKARRANLRDRLEIRVGDMLELPFDDNSFDVVLSTYSLCPVYNPAKGAEELFRVTRPAGLIGIAHSTEPENPIARRLADKVENVVWHFPAISLGCRSVTVLPTFRTLGCHIVFERHIGIPLWPFLVFVAEKPALEAART